MIYYNNYSYQNKGYKVNKVVKIITYSKHFQLKREKKIISQILVSPR